MADFGADEYLVRFISGVGSDGLVAKQAYQTWNGGGDYNDSSFSALSSARKWGNNTPGTSASVSYTFDAGSHWTSTEQAAEIQKSA